MTSKPFFAPWIGKRYTKDNSFGGRILLLGESHYGSQDCYTPDFTRWCVQALGIEDERHPFFNRVQKTLQEPQIGFPDRAARHSFWQDVAFANFIQEFPGQEHHNRPSTRQWREARSALPELLERLEPEFIAVLGMGVERWLPDLTTPLVTTRHPSSRGFSPAKWHPVVKEALDQFLTRNAR